MAQSRRPPGGRRTRSFGIIAIPESDSASSIEPILLKWSELPSWQQDNHYILAHYRPATYSYFLSFQSLFYIHNESVNIHSHLLGACLFFFISFTTYIFEVHPITLADLCVFGCFFGGAVICLGLSAVYHTISNHSPAVARLGNQLDYIGIVALIAGSFVPSVYYGFYCDPDKQKIYWGMASLLYCVLTTHEILNIEN